MRGGDGAATRSRAGRVRHPWRFLWSALLGGSLVLGCVTRGTYRAVAVERDRLAAEKHRLETELAKLRASNRSLENERLRLIDENEDLRERASSLERRVEQLGKRLAALERELELKRHELASTREEIAKLQGTYEGLVADLEAEVAAGQIQIEQLREGLRLNLADEILFPPGSAKLSPQGRELLRRVAERLRHVRQRIEVRGHTDATPIRGALAKRYPSNWDLAAARAVEVVRLLEKAGVPGERLAAVSLGQYHPVASNDTPEGRARNRRIEIRLLPAESSRPAPPGVPAPGSGREGSGAPSP